jgi:hypothetical protein
VFLFGPLVLTVAEISFFPESSYEDLIMRQRVPRKLSWSPARPQGATTQKTSMDSVWPSCRDSRALLAQNVPASRGIVNLCKCALHCCMETGGKYNVSY